METICSIAALPHQAGPISPQGTRPLGPRPSPSSVHSAQPAEPRAWWVQDSHKRQETEVRTTNPTHSDLGLPGHCHVQAFDHSWPRTPFFLPSKASCPDRLTSSCSTSSHLNPPTGQRCPPLSLSSRHYRRGWLLPTGGYVTFIRGSMCCFPGQADVLSSQLPGPVRCCL